MGVTTISAEEKILQCPEKGMQILKKREKKKSDKWMPVSLCAFTFLSFLAIFPKNPSMKICIFVHRILVCIESVP